MIELLLKVPFVCLLQPLETKIDKEVATHVKKVIVFLVNGMLCFEECSKYIPPRFNSGMNIKVQLGLEQFFRYLIQYFHIGIWFSMVSG
jgi:hypothetical protein